MNYTETLAEYKAKGNQPPRPLQFENKTLSFNIPRVDNESLAIMLNRLLDDLKVGQVRDLSITEYGYRLIVMVELPNYTEELKIYDTAMAE